jgi:predicted Zn finger-like uncharacterized protein
MLIVCPSCATSYMIDQAVVGPAGRTVRCARCKTTWHAGGPEPVSNVNALVDGVIAEAEAQAGGQRQSDSSVAASAPTASDDDFGADDRELPNAIDPSEPMPEKPATPALPRAEPFASTATDETPARISDAPSLVPPLEHEALPDPEAAAEPEDIESFVARRERMHAQRQKARRTSRWTAVLLVLFAFNVAVIGGRNDVVRYLPQTASLFAAIGLPVNLRHLRFENVRIKKETVDGVPILIVEGSIVSNANHPTKVPRLRFAARNKAKQEIYTWTMLPSRSTLQPGEKLDFRSRLGAPPKEAQDVMVRFFTAKDAAAKAN